MIESLKLFPLFDGARVGQTDLNALVDIVAGSVFWPNVWDPILESLISISYCGKKAGAKVVDARAVKA